MMARIRTIKPEFPSERAIVYALRMRSTDFVKIGFTTHLTARLQVLQTGNPHMLDVLAWIPGTLAIERQLHRTLEMRACVGEWFCLDDDEVVAALAAFGEVQR